MYPNYLKKRRIQKIQFYSPLSPPPYRGRKGKITIFTYKENEIKDILLIIELLIFRRKYKKKAGTPGSEDPSEPVYVISWLDSKPRYRGLRLLHP